MTRTALLLVAALAVSLALAGCIGGGGSDDAGTAPTSSSSSPSGSSGSSPSVDNGTQANRTKPQPSWSNETRQGSVTGASAGPLSVFSSGEEFEVPNGTLNLTLAIRSSNGELSVNVYPPCEDQGVAGTGLLADCTSYGFSTENGNATWGTDDPKPGAWNAFIFRQNDGAGEVSYQLTVARLLPP